MMEKNTTANDEQAAQGVPAAASQQAGRNTLLVRGVVYGLIFGVSLSFIFSRVNDVPVIPDVQLAVPGEKIPPEGKYALSDEDWFSFNIPIWEAALAPFKGQPNLNYLEIGVFEGRSMIWVLENVATDPTSTVTAIDPFDLVMKDYSVGGATLKETFLNNVDAAGGSDRLSVIEGFSQEELRRLPIGSFEIIYIDGSHTGPNVLEDAVLCHRLLKEGGVLIFDDYRWPKDLPPMDKPQIAVDTFFQFYGGDYDVLHKGYQLVLRKKAFAR